MAVISTAHTTRVSRKTDPRAAYVVQDARDAVQDARQDHLGGSFFRAQSSLCTAMTSEGDARTLSSLGSIAHSGSTKKHR